MAPKKTAIAITLVSATVFGVLWREFFTYARSLVYDWILSRLAAEVDPDDPRVKTVADFLALWGPILLVAALVWLATRRQRRTAEFAIAYARSQELENFKPAIEELKAEEAQLWAAFHSACQERPEGGGSIEHKMLVDGTLSSWRRFARRLSEFIERVTGEKRGDLLEPLPGFNPYEPASNEGQIRNRSAAHEYRHAAHQRPRILAAMTHLESSIEQELVQQRAITAGYNRR